MRRIALVLAIFSLVSASGCTGPNRTRGEAALVGGGVGAGVGAGIGALANGRDGALFGGLIGGVLGTVAGVIVGDYAAEEQTAYVQRETGLRGEIASLHRTNAELDRVIHSKQQQLRALDTRMHLLRRQVAGSRSLRAQAERRLSAERARYDQNIRLIVAERNAAQQALRTTRDPAARQALQGYAQRLGRLERVMWAERQKLRV